MGHKFGDRILGRAKKEVRREDVTALVPEWSEDLEGGRIHLRALTGMERDSWEAERTPTNFDDDGKVVATINSRNVRARAVQRTLVDEGGERLFVDAEALGTLVDGAILDRLYEVFLKLNRLVKDDKASLKNAPGGGGSGTPPEASDAQPTNCSPPATAPT